MDVLNLLQFVKGITNSPASSSLLLRSSKPIHLKMAQKKISKEELVHFLTFVEERPNCDIYSSGVAVVVLQLSSKCITLSPRSP